MLLFFYEKTSPRRKLSGMTDDRAKGNPGKEREDKRKAGLPPGGNPAYQSVGNHVSCHGTQKEGGLPPRDKEE